MPTGELPKLRQEGDIQELPALAEEPRHQTPDRPTPLNARLAHGMYIGPLVDYAQGAKWDRTRVARDIWQNFFDANNYTLDGINHSIAHSPEGDTVIYIQGNADYPYQRLLHFGGGYKADPTRSAGGHHEGAKIAALHLLRDYGCSRIVFRSQDWQLEYYLDTLEEALIENSALKGLHVRVTPMPHTHGNFVSLVTRDTSLAKAVIDTRSFFNHSENRELQSGFDVETDRGGIIVHEGKRGNVYLNGMKIAVGARNSYDHLSDLTILTKQRPSYGSRSIELSRDRDLITTDELEGIIIPWLTQSLNGEQCKDLIYLLEHFFPHRESYSMTPADKLLIGAIKRFLVFDDTMRFDKKYVAFDGMTALEQQTLESRGYIICHAEFADIAMRKASLVAREMYKVKKIEVGPELTARMEILKSLLAHILTPERRQLICEEIERFAIQHTSRKAREDYHVHQYVQNAFTVKDITPFVDSHDKILGMYQSDSVLIAREVLESENFFEAFRTYWHEVCHAFGTDDSVAFNYALTVTMGFILQYQHEHADEITQAVQEWSRYMPPARFDTIPAHAIQNLIDAQYKLGVSLSPYALETTDLFTSELEHILKHHGAPVSARSLSDAFRRIAEHPVFARVRAFKLPSLSPKQEEQKSKIEKQEEVLRAELNDLQQRQQAIEKQADPKGTLAQKDPKRLAYECERRGIKKVQNRIVRITAELAQLEKEYQPFFAFDRELSYKGEDLIRLIDESKSVEIEGRIYDLHAFSEPARFIVAACELLYETYEKKPFEKGVLAHELISLIQWLRNYHEAHPLTGIDMHEVIKRGLATVFIRRGADALNPDMPLLREYCSCVWHLFEKAKK